MVIEISRSEQKRRIKLLEKLVVELSKLPAGVIKNVPCHDEIKEQLLDVGNVKDGAKKRLLKYITKMLRDEPVDDLYDFLSKRKGKALQENKRNHEVEFFRDSLLNEAIEQHRIFKAQSLELPEKWASDVMLDIKDKLPEIDVIALQRLSSHYARTRNRRHSREVFRLIKAAMDDAK